MLSTFSENEILSKIKNDLLKKDYANFKQVTDLKIKFVKLPVSANNRASNFYKPNSDEYIIQFKETWFEIDFAHELTHGYLMFIEKIPLVHCNDPMCQLIRAYIEDIIVHRKIFNIYKIKPYDDIYLKEKIIKWTRDLFKKGSIEDSYWDPKGIKCEEFQKSLLYLQAWDFYKMTKDKHLARFLDSFQKSYKNKTEYNLAVMIIDIIKNNNNLLNNENYERTLREILQISYINIPISTIKYYEKDIVGYKLE